MTTIIDAIDTLNQAKHLFFAAQMAASDIDDMCQRSALEIVLIEASAKLREGIDGLDALRQRRRP